jgi:GTP cyclohydrolase I
MSRKEFHDPELVEKLAYHYREILTLLGEDPDREGLVKTPIRAAKAMIDITMGYHIDPREVVRKAIFTHLSNHMGSEMVIVKDIEFYSMCEHHILPFFGKISVGYIPDGKIVGLSKVARVVDVFARRLQVQERLTAEVCDIISQEVPNKGVIVACTGEHLCMKMRGVEKQHSATTTYNYSGLYESNPELRREFLDLIK